MLARIRKISLVVTALVLATAGCKEEETIRETGLPTIGTVAANVGSSYGLDDEATGLDLPAGLQVFVSDGAGAPVADAIVRVWPNARDPEPMAHQGGGRYEIDVLSERRDEVASAYFFQVISELLDPTTVVLRVPHEALTTRPAITAPIPNTDYPAGQDLEVSWEPVQGADCYTISTREHELQDWFTQTECIGETSTIILADQVHGFSFIRIRALRSLGDESFAASPYFSRSISDHQVRIFLEEPLP